MRAEHKELIHDYLNLERHIESIKKRMIQKEIEFNNQTFCGVTEFHPLGLKRNSFRVDDGVVRYIDLMNTYNQQIEMNNRRLHYFNHFLNSLDPHTKASLIRRYKECMCFDKIQGLGHDRIVLDEIAEIEDAISYEFNIVLSAELQRNAIQVEYTSFSQDTVENSFQAMQNLLGV